MRTLGKQKFVWVTVGLICCFGSAEGQIFGEKGLFNRKGKEEGRSMDEIGVPRPVTGSIETLKGHEVTFEIRAETNTPGASVEFLIRTFPSAGKIVSLVKNPKDRRSALITYFVPPDTSATKDAFAFAAKYRGGRYSSAVRFDIDIADRSSEILVSEALDFGAVMIGEESVKEITVINDGEGPYSRQLVLSPPWHIIEPGNGRLEIGAKGRRKVKIAFRPELSGETSYFLSFSRSRRGTTKLEGRGLDSFLIKTKEINLELDPESFERTGELVVLNQSSKPIRVTARSSTRLKNSLSEAYLLPPEKETRIHLTLGKTDTAPFDGLVEFAMKNGYAQSARVIAKVVPGRLEIKVPNAISSEVINFGEIEAGRSTERQITILNRGGLAVPLEFHVPAPFRLLTDPGPRLDSLSSVNLSLGLYPGVGQRGLVDVTMNVHSDTETRSIRLLSNVIPPDPNRVESPPSILGVGQEPLKGLRLSTKTKFPADSLSPESQIGSQVVPLAPPTAGAIDISLDASDGKQWFEGLEPEVVDSFRTSSGVVALPLTGRKYSAELRRPEDLTVIETGSHSVTLGWTAPRNSELARFEVEMVGVLTQPDGSEPAVVWYPYDKIEFERIDRLVKAKVNDLMPKSIYEMRVVMIDETGRSSGPSDPIRLETALPRDWTYIYIGVGLLLLAAVGLATFHVIRERRPEVYQSKYADA